MLIIFKDRNDAARQLWPLVAQYQQEINLVLAIPRGGVEIGAVLADKLKVPLRLINAKKIPAPNNPELALGAVSEGGGRWINPELARAYKLDAEAIDQAAATAYKKLQTDGERWGSSIQLDTIRGQGVLIIDDGAATGATLFAALEAVKEAGASPVGVAVPVAAIEVVSLMEDRTDFFLAVETPTDLLAVGQYYEDFSSVQEEDLQRLLKNHS